MEKITRREFNKKLAKSFLYSILVFFGLASLPEINRGDFKAKCPRDYYCLKRCPFNAISLDQDGFPLISKKKCVAWVKEVNKYKWPKCGLCLKGCPTRALEALK